MLPGIVEGLRGREGAQAKRNICRGGREERKERSSRAARVICEDAPAVVITWDLRLPREREGRIGTAAAGNGTDRFLLLLWGVTSHDPGMFMRPDSRRPWRLTAAEAESKSLRSVFVTTGPSSSSGPFCPPIAPEGGGRGTTSVTKTFLMTVLRVRLITRLVRDGLARGARR